MQAERMQAGGLRVTIGGVPSRRDCGAMDLECAEFFYVTPRAGDGVAELNLEEFAHVLDALIVTWGIPRGSHLFRLLAQIRVAPDRLGSNGKVYYDIPYHGWAFPRTEGSHVW